MTPQDQQQKEQGKRQHPLWILFSIGKSMKEVIIPIIYFFLININSEATFIKYGSLALIAYMVYRLIYILFSWKNFKYIITDKNIEITEGRLKTKKRFISIDRIQSVQQNTTFFHRMVHLTSLTLLTGTTDEESSVKLEVISTEEAENIQKQLQLLRKEPHENNQSVAAEIVDKTVEQPKLTVHYKMSRNEIIRAAFTSFYFLAPIFFLIAVYYKIEDLFALEDFTKSMLSSIHLSWILIALLILLLLIVSMIIGIILTYLQYGNFQIRSNEDRVFIQKGILSETNFSIPKNKINAIKLNKNMLRRWLKIVKVELISAGSIGEDQSQTNILFPFISEKRAIQLIPEILPDFQFETELNKLPKSALWASFLHPSYLWVIASAVLLYFWPAYWYASPGLLLLIIVLRTVAFYRSGYTLNDPFIQLQSGTFSIEVFITRRKKIAELEVTESLLQQKLGLASLSISTRAKPIEVTTIAHIPKEVAVHYYNWYGNGQGKERLGQNYFY